MAWAIVAWLAGPADREFLLNDLGEEFHTIVQRRGTRVARRWYWRQAITSVVPLTLFTNGELLRWLDTLTQDLRYGARNLFRVPGLVAISVLSLGLGIGLNLTLYAGVMTIFRHQPTMTDPASVVGIEPGNGRQFSYPNYRDLRDSGTFSDVVGFRISAMNRRVGDRLERLSVLVVTDNFFQSLGIQTRLGRPFGSGEAAPERAPRTIVLGYSYWRARFNADPGAIGQTMTLDGEAFTVVGVLPEGYRSVTGFMAPGAYVPVSALTLPTLTDRGSPTLSVLARLPEGTPRARARSAATAIGADLERRFPQMNEGMSRPAQVFPADAMQFRGTPVGFRLFPVFLLVLFGLVLLIGSVNVAGLLLARAVSRQHELTIRSALGASRARVIQTLLSESFLLSSLGGAAGLGLTCILSRSDFLGPMRGMQQLFSPDQRLLLPGLLLVGLTTVLCGVAPAVRSTRLSLIAGLRKGASGSTGPVGLRGTFIVGQVALSLTLLVVSSLCLRSQMRIVGIDLGFDLDHGVVARFNVDPVRGAIEARLAYADGAVERIERIPGMQSAALTALVPLGGDALVASFHPAGRSDIPGTRPSTLSVGPRYFETVAIPVLEGREFDASDRNGTPAVAIVNETFAKTYFPGRRALGQRIEIGGESDAEVVGIVRDSKIDTIGEAPKSVVFYPFAQRPRRLTIIARTAGNPAALVPAVRAAIAELDPTASITIGTLREAASTELNMRRVGTQMVGAIGIVGLLLTAIGLYGVVSYLVASRAAELGLRMALGATRRQLHLLVLGHAARLVGRGMAFGVGASLVIGPALATFLAGLSPADPIAFVAAAAVLTVVASAASYLPARRLSRVDPLVALRE
jgi:putative ABC transport system permease protein